MVNSKSAKTKELASTFHTVPTSSASFCMVTLLLWALELHIIWSAIKTYFTVWATYVRINRNMRRRTIERTRRMKTRGRQEEDTETVSGN